MTKIQSEIVVASAIALLPKDEIKAQQDGIKLNLSGLDRAVHDNAVQCMLHAQEHGDTSLMRRLLVDTLGGKNGYRTRGLINWMRKFSPMELKGDTINLSGVKNGEKRPFDIDGANNMPFWMDKDNDETVRKPVFQETLMSPILRVTKQITDAMENTVNGQPVDPSKAYFDGLYGDNLIDFAAKVKEMVNALPKDSTLEVRRAQTRMAEDAGIIQANGANLPEGLAKTA